MSAIVRAAKPQEYPALTELLARSFRNGPEDEGPLFDYLVTNVPGIEPACTRVVEVEGRPVAMTVVAPRRIRTRSGPVAGGVVTLVACEPDLQRQGYGSMAVRDTLRFMAERGMALGVLYGHPSYYPRFGFAPVLPGYAVELELASQPEAPSPALVEPAAEDLPVLSRLFEQGHGTYLLHVEREPAPGLWRTRRPDLHGLLMLPDRSGYAFVSHSASAENYLVREAGAATAEAGRQLLAGLIGEARRMGRTQLRLLLPADHLLSRLARQGSARLIYATAAAGMACITRWEQVLPEGYSITEQGLAYGGRPALTADRSTLTQLVLGYRSLEELALLPGVHTHLERQVAQDFPGVTVRWSEDPFWWYS